MSSSFEALSRAPSFLTKLAPTFATSWDALGADVFPGELSIATENSVYRFKNGVFLGRAKKGARSFECPKTMRALRLIGFLHDERDLWSLSPRWRSGTRAVLWKPGATDEQSFVLTSPANDFTLEVPEAKLSSSEPTPTPWVARAPSYSGIMVRHIARPPSIRRPLPPSTTRIDNAAPAAIPLARL